MKGFDFKLSTKGVWKPGEEIKRTPEGHAPRGIENARILLVKIQADAAGTEAAEGQSTLQTKK